MSKAKIVREWTVMVYLAGNNNLAQECVFNLTEMKKVGSTDKVAIVAQLETSVAEKTRYYIQRHDGPGNLAMDVRPEEQPHPGTQQSSPSVNRVKKNRFEDVLKDFVIWAVTEYPAEHYMLVLNGHGSGMIGDFLPGEGNRGLNGLTIPALCRVLKAVSPLLKNQKMDIVGMDSCLMSMTEVCYALKNYAQIIIGAQGFAPLAGWPYESILNKLNNLSSNGGIKSDEDLKTLTRDIVKQYVDYYSDYMQAAISVDHAACDLANIASLSKAIKGLSAVLLKQLQDPGTKAQIKKRPHSSALGGPAL